GEDELPGVRVGVRHRDLEGEVELHVLDAALLDGPGDLRDLWRLAHLGAAVGIAGGAVGIAGRGVGGIAPAATAAATAAAVIVVAAAGGQEQTAGEGEAEQQVQARCHGL